MDFCGFLEKAATNMYCLCFKTFTYHFAWEVSKFEFCDLSKGFAFYTFPYFTYQIEWEVLKFSFFTYQKAWVFDTSEAGGLVFARVIS